MLLDRQVSFQLILFGQYLCKALQKSLDSVIALLFQLSLRH